jgi:hypothetical protein
MVIINSININIFNALNFNTFHVAEGDMKSVKVELMGFYQQQIYFGACLK